MQLANILDEVLILTKEELGHIIGKSIRRCRKEHKLTQEKLAEAAGISVPHCAQIEAGARSVSLNVLYNMAIAQNVSTDAFM